MTEYARTAIRRLSIRGFRSIRSVDLTEIPDLVVLHGPNGAGKSNLLGAVQLILRAATQHGELPVKNERHAVLSLKQANEVLGLRPEDFYFGVRPEIRVAIDIVLGTRAAEILRAPMDQPLVPLSMEVVVQFPANDRIEYRFERADVGSDPRIASEVRQTLLTGLLQVSPAYRVPGANDDPEEKIYRKCVSIDKPEREAIRRLGERLASAGLFGVSKGPIVISPVEDKRYGDGRRIYITHPTHTDLPLRNLGSGEQQIVYMLAQRVVTPYPIAQIEEPEAHLHASLMEPFARILHESVSRDSGTPDVDQLWIATHHHHFAIAEHFYDVSLDPKEGTKVEKRPREEAIKHFYEPHPYWETLRTLIEDKMLDPDTILVEDDSGAIRARDVLSSMHGDRVIANRYVAASTKALVLSLAQERKGK
jgi:ABC-type transport system involved in cytochrome c biogenesis ATPase subunit